MFPLVFDTCNHYALIEKWRRATKIGVTYQINQDQVEHLPIDSQRVVSGSVPRSLRDEQPNMSHPEA